MLFNRSRRLFSLLCLVSLLCVLSFGTLVVMRQPASAQLSPTSVQSQVNTVDNSDGDGTTATDNYWTPERLRNAKSLPLPLPTSSRRTTSITPKKGTSVSRNGQAPTVDVAPDLENQLFTPTEPINPVNKAQIQPRNVGTIGTYFTSSRLIPLTADLEYPYRTVGKLFFTQPGVGDFVCSGSVIRPRVILTAGHCVHNGNGDSSGFFTNFLFVPAYRDGLAPYQRWNWSYVVVTDDWFNGNGVAVNAADFAVIEVADNSFSGTLRRIGDVTGYLGYQTQNLIPNHATLLGYPGNLDNGEKMHQVTAGSFQTQEPNTVLYGSDMRGGSSGGPWIQNFGVPADGQTAGLNSGSNQVIGVTSYGAIATDPLYEGSSIPDSSFTDILDTICSNKDGNC